MEKFRSLENQVSSVKLSFSSCAVMAASAAHLLNFGQTHLCIFCLLSSDLRQTFCKHLQNKVFQALLF